ncbi:MAG: hypothetical protein H7645_01700 [Candidatus Heimdallarchaeota archaeon]|nr:hypothetical protein [Candidatus Heimdallarchaeota archaeon]MCK4769031.1 hypothetical protein [Candidatus Heimdallarchaeota archaeon]
MKFKMNRRAVSPVVAIVLMFALTTAAIGISLAYMLPSISQFKDKSYNNSNNLYFIALDSAIQDLITNNPPMSKQIQINQEEGEFMIDSSWSVLFLLKDITGSQSSLVLEDQVTRFVHRSTAVADYDSGEHRYMIGPQDQDYLFINGSSTLYNEITVLNSSRTKYETTFLDLALYYRYALSINYKEAGSTEIYQLDIIHVNLILNESSLESTLQKHISLQLTYSGTQYEEYGTIDFVNDIEGEIRLLDQYNHFQNEFPIYFPINTNFVSHQINVNIIKIDIGVSFS